MRTIPKMLAALKPPDTLRKEREKRLSARLEARASSEGRIDRKRQGDRVERGNEEGEEQGRKEEGDGERWKTTHTIQLNRVIG